MIKSLNKTNIFTTLLNYKDIPVITELNNIKKNQIPNKIIIRSIHLTSTLKKQKSLEPINVLNKNSTKKNVNMWYQENYTDHQIQKITQFFTKETFPQSIYFTRQVIKDESKLFKIYLMKHLFSINKELNDDKLVCLQLRYYKIHQVMEPVLFWFGNKDTNGRCERLLHTLTEECQIKQTKRGATFLLSYSFFMKLKKTYYTFILNISTFVNNLVLHEEYNLNTKYLIGTNMIELSLRKNNKTAFVRYLPMFVRYSAVISSGVFFNVIFSAVAIKSFDAISQIRVVSLGKPFMYVTQFDFRGAIFKLPFLDIGYIKNNFEEEQHLLFEQRLLFDNTNLPQIKLDVNSRFWQLIGLVVQDEQTGQLTGLFDKGNSSSIDFVLKIAGLTKCWLKANLRWFIHSNLDSHKSIEVQSPSLFSLAIYTWLNDLSKDKLEGLIDLMFQHLINIINQTSIIKLVLRSAFFKGEFNAMIEKIITDYFNIIPDTDCQNKYLIELACCLLAEAIVCVLNENTSINSFRGLVDAISNTIRVDITKRSDVANNPIIIESCSLIDPYFKLTLPDQTTLEICYLHRQPGSTYDRRDVLLFKSMVYSQRNNCYYYFAHVLTALESAINRLIIVELLASNVQMIPGRKGDLNIFKKDLNQVTNVIHNVYTQLHVTRDQWVYDLFCNGLGESERDLLIKKHVTNFLKENPRSFESNILKNIYY